MAVFVERDLISASLGRSADVAAATRASWVAAIAAGVGTTVEYYDFQLFAIMSGFLAPVFFAGSDKRSAMFSTLAVFGGAFLARPIGGVVFGLIGDTKGRRIALLITVLGMGFASAATGLLPGIASIGLLAPLSLALLRLAQGFFAGGEVTGAATYIAESAPRHRRGFFGAFNPAASVFGLTLATAISALTETVVGPAAMREWGWRIPFLIAVPLIAICFLARRLMRESRSFERDPVHLQRQQKPIVEVLRSYRRPLAILIALGIAQNIASFMGLLYLNIQLTNWMGYSSVAISWLFAGASLLAGLAMPLAGRLSDAIGRKSVLGVGYLSYTILSPLAMFIANQGHFDWTIGAVLLACVPLVFVQAASYPLYAELFPTHVRYTGLSFGYNIATIIGGGTAPYLGAWLVDRTGSNLAPALFVAVSSVVAFGISRLLTETVDKDIDRVGVTE